ncbi:hypothetical protein NF27_CD00160 [Candidatus Jidaibacter acanthamoeba]|uniref:Uncharacterized protein n=1 Tax=Candidatus Jidaibacter acanthamoebae TaxID=86105 RepID=A0A0C1R189_9RICK|nr:tetratricopeptide repeat protein [Candidatus Jidaibacter acanthamoeba]KIE06040.1 hypothetical protein NF27_CD00160 [Candidatus Jidaibacter acanthamoeba]
MRQNTSSNINNISIQTNNIDDYVKQISTLENIKLNILKEIKREGNFAQHKKELEEIEAKIKIVYKLIKGKKKEDYKRESNNANMVPEKKEIGVLIENIKTEEVEEDKFVDNIIYLNKNEIRYKVNSIIKEAGKAYEAGDMETSLEEIKKGLQLCNNIINIGKYYELEYELFLKLGDIYFKGGDRLDYPKAVGIYQYIFNIIDRLPDGMDKEELRKVVENKIGLVEEEFIKQYNNDKRLPEGYSGKSSLEKIEEYKEGLEKHREWIKEELKKIEDLGIKEGEEELDEEGLEKRAKEVQRIYGGIREYFIGGHGLIKRLLTDCIEDLGGLPKVKVRDTGERREVEYAIFGMGSMALGTMTPWSDIEWGILIEEGLKKEDEQGAKEFFRNLAILMHIKVINFAESPLRMLGVKELNNFKLSLELREEDWFFDNLVNSGFSFDGPHWFACKTPLGRNGYKDHEDYELIGTVSDYKKFFEDNLWCEHDKHLIQTLIHIITIIDNNKLVIQYRKKLEENYSDVIRKLSFEVLIEDNIKFDPYTEILDFQKEGYLLNIKKEIYRFPDRTIVALGDIFYGKGISSWEIIENLYYSSKITLKNMHKLKLALSIAAELRLRTYSNNQGAIEDFSALIYYETKFNELEINYLTKHVFYCQDLRILFIYYFIILALNGFIRKMDSSTQKIDKDLKSYPTLVKSWVYTRFQKYYNAIKELESLNDGEKQELFIVKELASLYCRVGKYEKAFTLNKAIKNYTQKGSEDFITSLCFIGEVYIQTAQYSRALKYYSQALNYQINLHGSIHAKVATIINDIANIYAKKEDPKKAIMYHKIAFKVLGCLSYKRPEHIAREFVNLGAIYLASGKYNRALEYLNKSLVVNQSIYKGINSTLALILNNIGNVHEAQNDYKVALRYHKESYKIRKQIYREDHSDKLMSLINLADTYRNLEAYSKALKYYNKSLFIAYKIYNAIHPNIALIHNNIAILYEINKQYEEAFFHRIIDSTISLNHPETNSNNICISLSNLGKLYRHLRKFENAFNFTHFAWQICKDIKFINSKVYEAIREQYHISNNLLRLRTATIINDTDCTAYVEHAHCLLKHFNSTEILELVEILLERFLKLVKGKAYIHCNHLEKKMLITPLNQLLNDYEIINIESQILAYYLLIKVYNKNEEVEKAEKALKEFAMKVMKIKQQDAEVPLILLIDSYKELGFKYQSRIYQGIFDKIVSSNKKLAEESSSTRLI